MNSNLLVIGIDKYSRCRTLNNCVKDVNNVVDVLTDRYEFEKTMVTHLTDENANQANIINQFEYLLAKQTPSENLVILFSGHGDYEEKLDMGYILPIEAAIEDKSTYIPNTTIFNYIRAFEYRHIVLLFDSCFSGSVFTPVKGIPRPKERLFEIPSKWALTSGRIELVSDGLAGTNSPFAESLISSLKNNKEELLSISEVSRSVITDITGYYEQIPRGEPLQLLGHRGGEFMFKLKTKKSIAAPAKISIDETDEELKNILTTYYEVEQKIEDADNEYRFATANRLIEESNSINSFLKKEIIKIFELKKNDPNLVKEIEKLFGKSLINKLKEINNVYNEKNEIVKSQQFEKAAALRDKEKKLINEALVYLTEIKDKINKKLSLNEDNIVSDYCILSRIADLAVVYSKNKVKDYIDDNFINIYFQKLSKDFGYITKYRFADIFNKFKQEIIPIIVDKVTLTEKTNEEEERQIRLGLIAPKASPTIHGLETKKQRSQISETGSAAARPKRRR